MAINKRFKDLTGMRNGRLTILSWYGKDRHSHNLWLCKCDCGNTTIVDTNSLKRTHSCGCLARELTIKRNTTHGLAHDRLYNTWHKMIDRCSNPNTPTYKYYGGRGVDVCVEWRESFEAFYNWAMLNGYREDLTLDRIDVNGNYEPHNCRWVDITTQANNKRNSIKITYCGKTQTLKQWCNELNLKYTTIYKRYRRNLLPPNLFKV